MTGFDSPYAHEIMDDIIKQLVDQLAAQIATRVIGMVHQPTTWSSNSLPPDIRTKGRFHQLAPQVPGAVKTGRIWTVPADEWQRFRSRSTQKVDQLPVNVSPDDAALALSSLKKMRRTR